MGVENQSILIVNILGCFVYQPPICCSPGPVRAAGEVVEGAADEVFAVKRKKRAIDDEVYEKELSFSVKISMEGLISLMFVQLPGICLGLLGILKAFMNHGLSKAAAIDSLR